MALRQRHETDEMVTSKTKRVITEPMTEMNAYTAGPYLGFFVCGGKLRTGVSRMQTGFLVERFVFTPTQNVASKTFKETNHTDAFCFNCHDLYTIFNSSYTVNSSFTLCMDGSKNRLKAFVSLKSLY